jgi:DnaJ-class molecular chaperone
MTPNIKDNHVSTSRVSKCPVCVGKGRVPHGFYAMGIYVTSDSTSKDEWGEVCRSCHGKGIIIH